MSAALQLVDRYYIRGWEYRRRCYLDLAATLLKHGKGIGDLEDIQTLVEESGDPYDQHPAVAFIVTDMFYNDEGLGVFASAGAALEAISMYVEEEYLKETGKDDADYDLTDDDDEEIDARREEINLYPTAIVEGTEDDPVRLTE